MGVYEVFIDIAKGITFGYKSGGYVSDVRNRYIHPHIEASGIACWGTWHDTLLGMIKEQDYLSILRLAYEFLSECNNVGWYISGYAFAKDNKDRCPDCWELNSNCECDKCEHCREHTDNCDCIRCPSSGDRLDEIGSGYCNGCNSLNGDGRCEY